MSVALALVAVATVGYVTEIDLILL
jgi:hypothetical protein